MPATAPPATGLAGEGMGNVPPLAHGALQGVPDGAIFWYITKGGLENGMPSWAALPEEERWQLVTLYQVHERFGYGQRASRHRTGRA